MTDDDLRKVAELYNEIEGTAGVKIFLRNCSSFGLCSGSQKCDLPKRLQFRINLLVNSYLEELRKKREEL